MNRCLRPCLLAAGSAGLALSLGACGGSHPSHSSSRAILSTSARPTVTAPLAAGGAVTGSSGEVTATMHASGHKPRVNRPWPVHFTVTRGGRPVKATVAYEFLFAGRVVAHRSHYLFDGRFSDVVIWPSSAVGYPLTFRAVISSAGAVINLDYQVQVTR